MPPSPAFYPADYSRTLRPHEVEYRLVVGQGVRVVKIILHFPEPRFMAWSERFTAEHMEVQPMSMSLSEIELFVQDARRALGI